MILLQLYGKSIHCKSTYANAQNSNYCLTLTETLKKVSELSLVAALLALVTQESCRMPADDVRGSVSSAQVGTDSNT